MGLGNPGNIYADSRHNIGFFIVKALAKNYRIPFKKEKDIFSLSAKGKINDQNVILAMPFTFMNLSGAAVKALLKKYRIDLSNLMVICDDLDLEFGRLKIKPAGSRGGHRGLGSIIDSLGNQAFSRLRIGIGRPIHKLDASQYVLSSFTKTEKRQLKMIIKKACTCCEIWITKGITETMNIFNKRQATFKE